MFSNGNWESVISQNLSLIPVSVYQFFFFFCKQLSCVVVLDVTVLYFGSSQEHIRPWPGRNKKRAHALTGVTDLSEKSNSETNQNDRGEFLASGKLKLIPSGVSHPKVM